MRQRYPGWLKLLAVFCMLAFYSTAAQAALLDVGPVVPQVLGSTEGTPKLGDPPLGHGFPRWYRDTNRVPLELCLDRLNGQCATFEPNTGAALQFPNPPAIAGNFTGEAFWWTADASITSGDVVAALGMAIEAAFSTGDVAPGAQVSFARIRIRVTGLPSPGEYTVTTPYKEFKFDVVTDPKVGNEINFTEDIGIAIGGVFTGALGGSIGPFLYCSGAPYAHSGGQYLAPAGGLCTAPATAKGGSYPNTGLNSYAFSVAGPTVNPTVNISTTDFIIIGKVFTDPIPTPLTVDRATYTRDASGVQVNVFATTQAMSNQKAGGAGIEQFVLTNAPSVLQLSGTDIPPTAMTTNFAADGKFFATSGLFPAPVTFPLNVTVTNTADTPDTVTNNIPLVDEVVIAAAMYNPVNKKLTISASSYDTIVAPALQAYMPGMVDPLGTLTGGQLQVTFPLASTNPVRTFNIPPERITVVSAKGGSDTRPVTSLPPGTTNTAPTAVPDTADVAANGGTVVIDVAANDTDPDLGDLVVPASIVATNGTHGTTGLNPDGTITYTATSLVAATDTFTYTIRDGFGAISNSATVTVNILESASNAIPVANPDSAATLEDTPVIFSVTANDVDSNLAVNTVTINPASLLNGTAVVNANGSVTFTPAPNFSGTGSFTYTVKDTLGLVSNAAAVTITVSAVNDPPVAGNDSATTNEDTPVSINVVANDSDLELANVFAPNSVTIVSQPANGAAVANADNTVTFTPNLNFSGTTNFTYTVSDGPLVSNTATVTVTVNPVNDAPTAVNDVATIPAATPITINVLANDTDIDGTVSAIAAVTQPTNGSVTANVGGTVTYTSNTGFSGVDSFTYTVLDNNGLVSAAPATVTINVTSASTETVTVLRAQYRASTREWRVDGVRANGASNSVTLYVGRDLTGQVLGSAPVLVDGTWSFRLPGAPANPTPDATNTVSVQALPGGGSRLAFPVSVR